MHVQNFVTLFALAFSGIASAAPTEYSSVLDARGLSISVGTAVSGGATCPKTNAYAEHAYTKGQINAAFQKAAQLLADGKTVSSGRDDYPHDFGNKEELPFKCGSSTSEYPIETSGSVYNGGAVTTIGDRVVFEYRKKKDQLQVNFCGVMRHGDGRDFVNC